MTHIWRDCHSISISAYGLWERVGVQVSKKIHLHSMEFLNNTMYLAHQALKKNKIK